MTALKNMLVQGAGKIGLDINHKDALQLLHFQKLLLEANKKQNLTAISQPEQALEMHLIDSISPLRVIKTTGPLRVVDVGSGGGLPGIPLHILEPAWETVLVEAAAKKVRFLSEAIAALSLQNIRAIHGRAEDIGREGQWRESFDLALARAVAPLRVLLELCLPLVVPGGRMVAMKGPAVKEELAEAEKALQLLAGSVVQIDELTLPYSHAQRSLVVIEKTGPANSRYPRRAGVPSRRPL